MNTSEISNLDQNLQTRVLDFCRTHAPEFEQHLNQYLRRYLLKSRMTLFVTAFLFISGPLMALKTGHWQFILTHFPSCLLFLSYGVISKRIDFFNQRAASYAAILCSVLVIECMWTFYEYSVFGNINLIASAAPLLLMATVWALHVYPSEIKNIVHASANTLAIVAFIGWLDIGYLKVNVGGIIGGAVFGALIHSLVFKLFRYQFFFSQQEKNLRTHAYRQLEKVLYPHQRKMIEDGLTLEETMPVGWGEACVIAFDVVESSKIKSPYARTLLQNTLKKCQALMMQNYAQGSFEANAYRIKEMGDGFLCSVGYPFKVPGALSKEALAIKLSQQFIAIFHEEAAKLAPGETVLCAVGIASGVIESFYPHTTPKEYDLYGRPLILATRYEAIRKELFQSIPRTSLIILQESVHLRLQPQLQGSFTGFELLNFRIRDDHEAKRLFYQAFDKQGLPYGRPPQAVVRAS